MPSTAPITFTIDPTAIAEIIIERMKTEIKPAPRFYSPKEFAAALRVTAPHVQKYCKLGLIHGVRLGTRWCIPETEFARLIEIGGVHPPAELYEDEEEDE